MIRIVPPGDPHWILQHLMDCKKALEENNIQQDRFVVIPEWMAKAIRKGRQNGKSISSVLRAGGITPVVSGDRVRRVRQGRASRVRRSQRR